MTKCPVCPANNIPDEAKTCPSCGTDLSPLHRLRELAAAYVNDSIRLERIGTTDAAMNRAMGAVMLDDEDPVARKILGKLLWKKQLFREAMEQWEQADKLAPGDKNTTDMLALAHRKLKMQGIRKVVTLLVIACSLLLLLATTTVVNLVVIDRRLTTKIEKTMVARLSERAGVGELQVIDVPVKKQQKENDSTSTNDADLMKIQAGLANEQFLQDSVNVDIKKLSGMVQDLQNRYEQLAMAADKLAAEAKSANQGLDSMTVAMEKNHEYMQKSLVLLCELLRPHNAESLLSEIQQSEHELGTLRQIEEKHRARGIFLIDHLAIADIKRKIGRLEKKLTLLKEEYDEYVIPWQEVVKSVEQSEKGTGLHVVP